MRKTYLLLELDCANCAAKMEKNIREIEGVKDASVNFLSQKLVLEADDAIFEDILKKAKRVVRKIEPDCSIAE